MPCFRFISSRQFLAAGTSLDQFLKLYVTANRFCFPYEYLVSSDKLSETFLPPYSAFFSKLQDKTFSTMKFKTFIKNSDSGPNLRISKTGEENYEIIKEVWHSKNFQTMLDIVKCYNCLDVQPSHEAVQKKIEFYRVEKIVFIFTNI